MDRGTIPADGPDMTASVKGDGTLAAAADEGTGSIPRKNRERRTRPSTESAEAVEASATGRFATLAFSSWLASGIPLYACLAKSQVDVGSTPMAST